ncbi:MAG: class I SAM-dependent methyltransferase [Bacteroidetes bacterium]|nr:class I SAM-dependent methyltransferase [Bacteroidota bacterium]
MQERYINRELYFNEQVYTTANFVVPYVQSVMQITSSTRVLEVGCGEGGNLKPFLDMGCLCVGIDLSETKIENGKKYFASHKNNVNLKMICEDIYKVTPADTEKYDLIIMRDTIEHIPNQDYFMDYLKKFIAPGGKIFIAYPPWQMPFGGHQQVCTSKLLKVLPYVHLLPKFIHVAILKAFGESEETIQSLMEVRETGISMESLKKIFTKRGYKIDKEDFYFINPNYEIKFKLKTKTVLPIFNIPYIRNFYTTCYYCVLSVSGI